MSVTATTGYLPQDKEQAAPELLQKYWTTWMPQNFEVVIPCHIFLFSSCGPNSAYQSP